MYECVRKHTNTHAHACVFMALSICTHITRYINEWQLNMLFRNANTHRELSICRDSLACWLAGCFLALALLPASPLCSLCDLMQVLPHSSVSSCRFSTFSFSISVSQSSFLYCLSLFRSFLFLLYFELPYVSITYSPYIFLSHLLAFTETFCLSFVL